MKKTISFMILLFTLAIILRIKTVKNNKDYEALKIALIKWKLFSREEKNKKESIKEIIYLLKD
jgi:hypothetical protein